MHLHHREVLRVSRVQGVTAETSHEPASEPERDHVVVSTPLKGFDEVGRLADVTCCPSRFVVGESRWNRGFVHARIVPSADDIGVCLPRSGVTTLGWDIGGGGELRI